MNSDCFLFSLTRRFTTYPKRSDFHSVAFTNPARLARFASGRAALRTFRPLFRPDRWSRWLGKEFLSESPQPIRTRRMFRPSFGSLESRFVLNASAELNTLGQLVISGTAAAETVQLDVDASGNLTLRDQFDQIIPIANHPSNPSDPLSPLAVTSGHVIVDLGPGDDRFLAQLPSSLNVTLLDNGGNDYAELTLTDRGPSAAVTHRIHAESILLRQDTATISLLDDSLLLHGDTRIGSDLMDSQIDIGAGHLSIDGRMIVRGNVEIIGGGGSVDLGDAVITSESAGRSLSFDIGNQASASLHFGGADDSAGFLIQDLQIRSASQVVFAGSLTEIAGDLTIGSANIAMQVESVTSESSIVANRLQIDSINQIILSNSVDANSVGLTTLGGNVQIAGSLTARESLFISASGGDVDLGQSEIISSAVGSWGTIINAGQVTLGDIDAPHAAMVLGASQDIHGPLTQASGTEIVIDQLQISSSDTVNLSASGNAIGSIASLTAGGEVSIVDSAGGLVIGRIDSGGGGVQVVTTGNNAEILVAESILTSGGAVRLLAADRITMRDGGIIDAGTGSVALHADGDITLGGIKTINDSDDAVSIRSDAGAILDGGDLDIDIDANFGHVKLLSALGIGDLNAVETRIDRLTADVTNTGAIRINELDSIQLTADDSGQNDLALRTSNGQIQVTAAGDIVISDQRPAAANGAFEVTPKIIAAGDHGRIQLAAGESSTLQVGNGVSLVASQATLGAIQLSGGDVVLGEQIELRTGEAVGVARYFAPRPTLEPELDPLTQEPLIASSEAAFFDTQTVRTNRLEQAINNGGAGILSLVVGQTGEQGLTLNIDWGADTHRYQQVDLLVGGENVNVSHVYTEADILNSQLNGRPSATDPLEVRFSVRHHQSIVVTGNSITQGAYESEPVDAGVISSTDNDNPLRPDLGLTMTTNTVSDNASLQHLNGQAQFIIPNLSIPVAFFPVRNVIPEPEQAEILIRSDTVLAPRGGGVETSEASASPAVGRDEFFQIRVLSPDPYGDDLAAPDRLPDNILEGDKLKRLFRSLPDGRYAIEYVLGDGNERTIIQVDVRDGQPINTGDDSQGGFLKLKVIEADSNEQGPNDQTDVNDQTNHPNPFSKSARFARNLAADAVQANPFGDLTH